MAKDKQVIDTTELVTMDKTSLMYYQKLLGSEQVPPIVRQKHERLMSYLRVIGGYSRPEVETQALLLSTIDPEKIRGQIASMEQEYATRTAERERAQNERIAKMDAEREKAEAVPST